MEIHEKIAAVIDDHDTYQEELAQVIGCNQKQITRWKRGEAEMGIYKLKAFCEFYGVSADYILGLPRDAEWPR